jgi:hypothetical protein
VVRVGARLPDKVRDSENAQCICRTIAEGIRESPHIGFTKGLPVHRQLRRTRMDLAIQWSRWDSGQTNCMTDQCELAYHSVRHCPRQPYEPDKAVEWW